MTAAASDLSDAFTPNVHVSEAAEAQRARAAAPLAFALRAAAYARLPPP